MKAEEIRDIAINSSTAYYNYLDQNAKGVQTIDVSELEYLESKDLLIKLRLSAKLFDTEAIFFRNLKNNIKYDTGQVKVVEYDSDKNILLIKPSNELVDEFQNLQYIDIKVISDLKFLVQRVKVWYEINGANIAIPDNKSSLKETLNAIKFFPETKFQPSINQKQSIENIFTNPFSYIWGAPGTGKTQFVLAYSVLHYLNNKKKVAIFAPTNNSLEQVLRGVIAMIDKAGIDRTQIIRLGTPSKKFAEDFPEVCEEKGVQKQLQEIDKQISILERVISYNHAIEEIFNKERNLKYFDDLFIAYQKQNKAKDDLDNQNCLKKKKEIDIKYKSDEIQKLTFERHAIEKKKNSVGYKISKILYLSSTNLDDKIDLIQSRITKASKELDFYQYEQDQIIEEQKAQQEIIEEAKKYIFDLISILESAFQGNSSYEKQIADLSEINLNDTKSKIESELKKEREAREIDSHLIIEYQQIPIQQIQDKIAESIYLRNKLAIFSTEERLKNVQVIACTLDGYIGRYTEKKLNVDHIFLDEAGYANIIKALTLFNNQVPITLLGDHMQLPPVCEIDNNDIQHQDIYKNMFLWAQSAIHLDHLFTCNRNTCLEQYINNNPFNPVSIKKTSLNATYRFGNNLAMILGLHVYDNQFCSQNPKGETRIFYVNAKKEEALYSRESKNEGFAIRDLIKRLKKNREEDFIVLTPYKKQIRILNRLLPEERNNLKILTVHGSQGREWDTVILSVVDTSDMFFVKSTLEIGKKLLNTAVSRAKSQLIIVCDKSFWINQNGQLLTDLIKTGEEIYY